MSRFISFLVFSYSNMFHLASHIVTSQEKAKVSLDEIAQSLANENRLDIAARSRQL